jgi:hypothetical protein
VPDELVAVEAGNVEDPGELVRVADTHVVDPGRSDCAAEGSQYTTSTCAPRLDPQMAISALGWSTTTRRASSDCTGMSSGMVSGKVAMGGYL